MTFSQFLQAIPHKFKPEEVKLLEQAFELSEKAHLGQTRHSGERYFSHPLEAAITLGQIFPDATTIAATLLHDVPEDTTIQLSEIEQQFGPEVASLVDGVTKLSQIRLRGSTEQHYLESLRKMFLATSRDIRVILVKLADRLHNMRTLSHVPAEKQPRIAKETLEVYAPVAGRLGMGTWKDELENLAFAIADPENFQNAARMLKQEMANRLPLKDILKELSSLLRLEGVKYEEIDGREKRPYSLHKKLLKYEGDTSQISDLVAVRVITKTTGDCYAVLGAIHKHLQPIPGKIKDYIAMPKPNGYRSLHTTVFGRDGKPFEVQIRTQTMHEEADRGIAAHWFYTESGKQSQKLHETQAMLVQELRSWQDEGATAKELLEALKIDFFQDRIFVLTPEGDVKDLPRGATVIDFAFAVHTDMGLHMSGAKINRKMASIYDELNQGDVVEILKSKKPVAISRHWLDSAHTRHARSKIKQALGLKL